MYEQHEVPVFRRILWIALWFVVTVAILWVLIWLIFFHHSPKPKANHAKTSTQTTQPLSKKPTSSNNPKNSTSPSKSGTSGSKSTTNSKDSSTSSGTTNGETSTGELANTGAGDIVTPFVVATITGSAFYYIRLRKKVTA